MKNPLAAWSFRGTTGWMPVMWNLQHVGTLSVFAKSSVARQKIRNKRWNKKLESDIFMNVETVFSMWPALLGFSSLCWGGIMLLLILRLMNVPDFSVSLQVFLFPGGTFVVTLGSSDKSETMTCRLSNNHRWTSVKPTVFQIKLQFKLHKNPFSFSFWCLSVPSGNLVLCVYVFIYLPPT